MKRPVVVTNETNEIPDLSKVTIVQLSFDSNIREENDSRVIATILGPTMDFYHEVPFIHFRETGLNKYQRGLYNYGIDASKDDGKNILTITVHSEKDTVKLSNVKLTFMIAKW